jgi:hypothetical protein
LGPPYVSRELQLAPVALPLWFVIDSICPLSARQALGRFLLGDWHSILFLTLLWAASVSSSASFGRPTLLVNASEPEFYTKVSRKRAMRVRNMIWPTKHGMIEWRDLLHHW